MPDIRDISAREVPNTDRDYVLIESLSNHKFVGSGSATGKIGAIYWTPPIFDTFEAALSHGVSWAEAHGVQVVYVRSR